MKYYFVVILFIYGLSFSACFNKHIKERDEMNVNFSDIFGNAVASEGTEYIQLRDALKNYPNIDTELQQVVGSSNEWQRIWVANIILGWRKNAKLYEDADKFIRGRLDKRLPIMGKFSVTDRAKAVAGLGNDIIPRLIEIVWKTKEYDDSAMIGTVFGALRQISLPETANPIRTLIGQLSYPEYRHSAITTLGDLKDEIAYSDIQRIMLSSTEEPQIRIGALYYYINFEYSDTYKTITYILTNEHNPEDLRISAAEILGERDDKDTRVLFHDMINNDISGELLWTLVDGLGKHGNEESLKLLNELKNKTTDEDLQLLIDETISAIENR